MHVPKTLKDIRTPANARSGTKNGSRMRYSSFVISEIRSPQDIRIDRQLQAIFNRLNQSYSTSVNTPHTAFLKQQIDDFLHESQTVYLFHDRPPTVAPARKGHPAMSDHRPANESTTAIPISFYGTATGPILPDQ